MLDMTLTRTDVAVAERPAGPFPAPADRREEKLSLPHSTMLIVLGSGGGWFLLAAAARWLIS